MQVRGGVEVEREREILVHGLDAEALRVGRTVQDHPAAVDLDASGVQRQDTGECLHQRALARAVVADERHDLARVDAETGAPQRFDVAEALHDVVCGKPRRRHRIGHVVLPLVRPGLPRRPTGSGRRRILNPLDLLSQRKAIDS
jgi:hypothetical protein